MQTCTHNRRLAYPVYLWEFVVVVLRNEFYMSAMCYTNMEVMGSLRPVSESFLTRSVFKHTCCTVINILVKTAGKRPTPRCENQRNKLETAVSVHSGTYTLSGARSARRHSGFLCRDHNHILLSFTLFITHSLSFVMCPLLLAVNDMYRGECVSNYIDNITCCPHKHN